MYKFYGIWNVKQLSLQQLRLAFKTVKVLLYRFSFASISYNIWNPFVLFPEFITIDWTSSNVSFVYLTPSLRVWWSFVRRVYLLSLQTKSYDVTIQMKALCLYVHMVLFVCQNVRKWNLEIFSKFAFGHIWQLGLITFANVIIQLIR